jgi:ABC-2 type transport system ATP-binding protein
VTIIETHSLSRAYGRRRGIESVSLRVPEGCLFGFLGQNGAGKTTAIRVLIGLLRPSAGTARIFGRDCWNDSAAIKADVGYLPGDLRMHGWMDGRTALRIWGYARGRDLMTAGHKLAERFDLDLKVKVRNMSRGMRQKLGLILALAHSPRLFILDEPTVTLDPVMQHVVEELLREMAAEGHTVFFSSHSLSEVERLCDRVAVIRNGRIVADESLETLRQRAGHEVVVRWPDAAAAAVEPPAFLRIHARDGLTWHATLHGGVEPMIAWLAGRALADLNIGPPDLETLFRNYYSVGNHTDVEIG